MRKEKEKPEQELKRKRKEKTTHKEGKNEIRPALQNTAKVSKNITERIDEI
jgi:hypothetical protein